MTGYDYGNARLRAMRSDLLDLGDYTALVAVGSLDAFLGALHDTPYEPDLEAAMARERGLRSVDEAVRRNLSRTLRAMRSFYADEAGRLVSLLVRRWDIRNLRSLLRARAQPGPIDAVTPELVAAGDLTESELTELAAAPGLRALIDLMVAWELPDRSSARRVMAQVPTFETSGEITALERALFQGWGESLAGQLADLPEDSGLALILSSEVDKSNLLTAVRYWEAGHSGESVPASLDVELTPGGRIAHGPLGGAVRHDNRGDVARDLASTHGLPGWDLALGRWAEHGQSARLAEELSQAVTKAAMRLFSADPLSVSVPTAFTFAKEAEAQNVRLIARGVLHGFHPEEIIEHVVAA